MKKEFEVRFAETLASGVMKNWIVRASSVATVATLTACGGAAPPHAASPSPKPETSGSGARSDTDEAAANAPPSDSRPYGYEFAPVSPTVEKTKPAPPTTLPTGPGGRLFPEAISGVVRNHFDEIGRCYDAGQRKNAKLAGTITVKSSFGRDGVPSDVVDQGSTLPDREVVDCVVGVFRSLRYPASRGGQVTFVYPIKLGS